MDYAVQLDVFRGPLDLLLYLVRKQELDIAELPLAKITAQFNEFLIALEILDLDLAAEFLVTATTLAEFKSQHVLPRQAEEEPDQEELPEEPDSNLVARLVEYKRYKDASKVLEAMAAEAAERFERISERPEKVSRDPQQDRIKDIELWDLLSAFARIVKSQLATDETKLQDKEIPVHIYVEQVGAEIVAKGEVCFFELFAGKRKRSPIVGIFLAILELVRHHGFRAEQRELFGDIILRPPPEGFNRDTEVRPDADSPTQALKQPLAGRKADYDDDESSTMDADSEEDPVDEIDDETAAEDDYPE